MPRIISGVSQISDDSGGMDDQDDEEREQQVGGEGGEELRRRLDEPGQPGRSPIQTPIGTQTRRASTISTATSTRAR